MEADNCPIDANANQTDADIDGIGDVCEADTDRKHAGPYGRVFSA